jgi:diguanylate cyclase (GGDEF)-like protein/PAS domain S-box-containing protein
VRVSPDDERARQFEAVVQGGPDFVAFATVEGEVVFVNESGRRLVGIDAQTDVGSMVLADFLPDGGQAARRELADVLSTGSWTGVGTLRDWRGGPPIPVSVTSFVARHAETGEPLGVATVRRDLRPSLQIDVETEKREQRDRALLHHMSDVLLVVGTDRTLRYASPSASRVLGAASGWTDGPDLLELVHTDDRASTRAALDEVAGHTGEPALLRLRLRGADGAFGHYEALATNLVDDEAVAGILIGVRDIAERHKAAEAERALTSVLELIAGEAPIGAVLEALAISVERQLEDTICTVLLVTGSGQEAVFAYGASPSMPTEYESALVGRVIETHPSPCGLAVRSRSPVFVADIDTDVRFRPMRPLARVCDVRSCWSYPVVSPTTDALLGTFALHTRTPGLPDPQTSAIVDRASRLVAIALDRHVLVSRLAHKAEHDELTGLPNRLALLTRLEEALDKEPEPGYVGPLVLLLDLDRLKIVNDSLGHEVGDELLKVIAERLPDAVPDGSLVARFGGDEFAVLVDRLEDPRQAAELAERVLTSVAAPVALVGRTVTPSASVGVVIATRDRSATEVIRDADIAMYRAKHGGGARHAFFTSDMSKRAFDRLDLEEQIRQGLARDEFRVYYQPMLNLRDGDTLAGFEALVRWQHPERGLLGPDAFVDLAVETGLIVELGAWVLHTVARTARRWATRFPDRSGTVAVNLAFRQLVEPRLVEVVREAASTMAPWLLSLELTESTLMSDTEATRTVVDDLVGLGTWLAIDDFGTGFSSLAYLTRLPVQVLKIDGSFVQDLANPGAAAVAATIVNLAHSLDLKVVAEGIETAAQHAAVVEMGCHFGQGYLLGMPLPEAEAEELLASTEVISLRG